LLSFIMPNSEPNHVPIYLYRYMSLNDAGLLYAERIILHNELYFTSPANVNDPFDCIVDLDFSAPDNDWYQYLIGLSQRLQPQLSENKHEKWVDSIIKSGKHKEREIQSLILGDLQNSVHSIGLLCLTERNNCILMWSHYADSHSGICLEFANYDSEPFIGAPQRVNYLPVYTKAHAIYDHIYAQANRIFLSKSKCWEYEAEWRIIDHQTGHGVKYFEPTVLKGVILGCKIPDAHEQLILKWVSERKYPIIVYKAKQSPDGFNMIIEKLS